MTAVAEILFQDVETAAFVARDDETVPLAPDEVAGETLYSLLSAGTELNIYLGEYQKQGLAWGRLPFVPGYAAVFQVEAVGSDVDDIAVGDVVFCMGKHMSRQRLPRRNVLPLPAGLDPVMGPFARLANIGMSCLTTAEARPPATVVSMGLGLVGLAGAMLFDLSGYRVIAVDPVEARRELARERGLTEVVSEIDPSAVGKVPLVLDFSGHETAISAGLDVVAQGGEVVVAGVPMIRKADIYAQEILNKVFRSVARLRSGKEQQVAAHPTPFRSGSMFENMAGVLQWIADGRLNFEGLYEMGSPRDAQSIYQDVLHIRHGKLTVMFDWSDI